MSAMLTTSNRSVYVFSTLPANFLPPPSPQRPQSGLETGSPNSLDQRGRSPDSQNQEALSGPTSGATRPSVPRASLIRRLPYPSHRPLQSPRSALFTHSQYTPRRTPIFQADSQLHPDYRRNQESRPIEYSACIATALLQPTQTVPGQAIAQNSTVIAPYYPFPNSGTMAATGERPTDPNSNMLSTSPESLLFRRVVAQGSPALGNGSASGSGSGSTPTNGTQPLPLTPPSGGAHTPRAAMVQLSSPTHHPGERLATDLHQLQVRSPEFHDDLQLPPDSESIGSSIYNATASSSTFPSNALDRSHHRQYSTNSSSTEGSSIHVPSSLGEYDSNGFIKSTWMPRNDAPADPYVAAQAEAVVARADEAIMQLNGTDSVQAAAGPSGTHSPYSLPRGFDNFTNPFQRYRQPSPNRGNSSTSRQSSASSATTEASTSSEESDHCIPQWVTIPTIEQPSDRYPLGYRFTQYTPTALPQIRPRTPAAATRPDHIGIHGRRTSSPRRMSGSHSNIGSHARLPVDNSPLGTSSALPSGLHVDEEAEDDDDEDTVGQDRERSPSTSSESGFDILLHAANQGSARVPPTAGKGKRKAGVESVANWRENGIPSGAGSKGSRRPSMKEAKSPPHKRRRSDMSDSQIDPSLHDDEPAPPSSPTMIENDAAFEDSDAELNSGDSEYGASSSKRRRSKGKGKAKAAPARGRPSGTSSGKAVAGKAETGKKGTIKSKAGAKKNGNAGAKGSGGPIACDYVSPYPPYERCQETFTRVYDLPRHRERHGREEGELVAAGKLSEELALEWQKQKDKAKITCPTCGEHFTRNDALSRHNMKQHSRK